MKDFLKWYKSKLDSNDDITNFMYGLAGITVGLLVGVLTIGFCYAMAATKGLALLAAPVGIYVWYNVDTKEKHNE